MLSHVDGGQHFSSGIWPPRNIHYGRCVWAQRYSSSPCTRTVARKPSAPRWSCALLCLCTVRHDDGQTFAERTEHHSFYHTARPAACLLCMTIQSPQTPGHTATSSPEHTTKTSDLGARALADAGQRQRGSISLNAIVVIEKHLPSTST